MARKRGPESIVESGWPLGMFQAGATELEPEGSAQTIVGIVGDDGLPRRRGGVTYKSNAAFGAAGLLGIWSGYVLAGLRTLFWRSGVIGVLASDDATPQTASASGPSGPRRPVTVAGNVAVPDGTTEFVYLYGGSYKTSSYTTGTVSMTHAGTGVTGAGTTWSTNADVGMLFTAPDGKVYTVARVVSNVTLTLSQPYLGATAAGGAYTLSPVGLSAVPAAVGVTPLIPVGAASVANRLAVGGDFLGEARVHFTAINYPGSFTDTDYHSFPAKILALGALRDILLVFTTVGVYAISNMAYDLTDASGNPQQRVELVNADLVAFGHEGIAAWKGALVVPALDGIWLMDGVSSPVRISDRIADLYASYIAAGHKAGAGEVLGGAYLLPILTSANVWVDTLVCRLQPTHQGGDYAWSQLAGFGAQVTAFAERPSSPPVLLGASTASSSRVLSCTSYFAPTAAVKNDADGTTHTFQLTTRNIPIGDKPTGVSYIRAWYSLIDAASDNPTITAEASVDGGSYVTLTPSTGTTGTTAGEQDGSIAVYWPVQLAGRFVRFRFTSTSPAASLQFKRYEVFYRQRGN